MNLSSFIVFSRKWAVVGFTLLTSVVVAQGATTALCQQIISEALLSTSRACRDLSRNYVCYGNRLNTATAAAGTAALQFEEVGDRLSLMEVASLQLSPLNEAQSLWGIAMMQVQATLPDALPGQNVTFLLFGGVTLETPFHASGVVGARAAEPAGPPKAFYLTTGIGQPRCAEAPSSGLIVQTPEGTGMVSFTINGVEIAIGSTAVISQSESGTIGVALMEGHGIVEANGVSQVLVPGSETYVLPQSNELALRYPSDAAAIQSQQFSVAQQAFSLLPRSVNLPEPATQDQLNRAIRESREIRRTEADFINGCPRPAGWTTYKVRKTDTMSRISGAAGISVDELAAANCIANPRLIVKGTILFVPVRLTRPDNRESGGDENSGSDQMPENDNRNCSHPGNGNGHGNGHCKNGNGHGNGHDKHDDD